MTMLDPRSTTQMLSCGSTRTAWPNRNPYTPWPISRMYFPFESNSKSREPPWVKVRDAPKVANSLPVRV